MALLKNDTRSHSYILLYSQTRGGYKIYIEGGYKSYIIVLVFEGGTRVISGGTSYIGGTRRGCKSYIAPQPGRHWGPGKVDVRTVDLSVIKPKITCGRQLPV